MASVNAFLTRRQLTPCEDNMEQGNVAVYTEGTIRTHAISNFCWRAPATGTAIVEIWGAGGSSGRTCCCGGGIPGNSGAYVQKTICVCSGSYVCGIAGFACANTSNLQTRGCSESTCVCWIGANGTCGCLCAEGGHGGYSNCINTGSIYCCFLVTGFCGSQGCFTGTGCGIICNRTSSMAAAAGGKAYGGDINVESKIGCTTFMLGCQPCCEGCYNLIHVPVPAGIMTTDGAILTFQRDWQGDCGGQYSNVSGIGYHQLMNAISVASRTPSGAFPPTHCWAYTGACGGYESQGCHPFLPIGMGAPPPYSSPINYTDFGWRGGAGSIRVKYLDCAIS